MEMINVMEDKGGDEAMRFNRIMSGRQKESVRFHQRARRPYPHPSVRRIQSCEEKSDGCHQIGPQNRKEANAIPKEEENQGVMVRKQKAKAFIRHIRMKAIGKEKIETK